MTEPRAVLEAYAAQPYTDGAGGSQTRAECAPGAIAAMRAVLDLHHDRPSWNGTEHVPSGTCNACSEREDTYDDIPWPCPTVRAITTALEAS
jgi:hypothetical protein